MNSAVVIAVVSAVTASVATATLQNLRSIWFWFRKVRWKTELRMGQWWTRNQGYIPRPSRAPDFRAVPWYKTGRTGLTLRHRATRQTDPDLGICLDDPCVQTKQASCRVATEREPRADEAEPIRRPDADQVSGRLVILAARLTADQSPPEP